MKGRSVPQTEKYEVKVIDETNDLNGSAVFTVRLAADFPSRTMKDFPEKRRTSWPSGTIM